MTLVMDGKSVRRELFETQCDRRRVVRVRQQRPVKVYDARSQRYFAGLTRDISSTGLQIEIAANTVVREGQIISVHVGLNSSGGMLANRRQMIPARVIWISRAARRRFTVAVGVEFIASISARLDAA